MRSLRVLVLVDEHVVEQRRQLGGGGRRGRERLPEQQEVVVVEDVLLPLPLRVPAEDLPDPHRLVQEPRVGASGRPPADRRR